MNFLFICSRNQWRSPTAEQVFAQGYGIYTRSAGTSRHARHTINSRDIAWADLILVMEERHKKQLAMQYSRQLQHKKNGCAGYPGRLPVYGRRTGGIA